MEDRLRARPQRFVAVTDPGSPLEQRARDRGFREVFPHPPDVGGRYAALTVVGGRGRRVCHVHLQRPENVAPLASAAR